MRLKKEEGIRGPSQRSKNQQGQRPNQNQLIKKNPLLARNEKEAPNKQMKREVDLKN